MRKISAYIGNGEKPISAYIGAGKKGGGQGGFPPPGQRAFCDTKCVSGKVKNSFLTHLSGVKSRLFFFQY